MNIVWILNGCGLESRSITGGPVRFHEVSRRWTGPDVRQTLMTTSGGEAMLRGLGCALETVRVPAALFLKSEPCRAFRLWSYLVSSASCGKSVRELEASCDEDTVILTASDYFCDIVPALRLKRRTGARWIAWIHHRETDPATRPGNPIVNRLTYRMQEWSFRKIARHADGAWTYSTDAGDAVRARLAEFGMSPERVRSMDCGIDGGLLSAAPDPPRKTADAAMIGVRPNKGMWDIAPIWDIVRKKRPGTTLRLMGGMSGEGPVLEDLAARGIARDIEVFRPEGGFLSAADYARKIKEARILFAPSHEEGWGIVVCEAMAAGVPVVAYDLPVYRRIYGDAFLRVPCFDTEAFAETVVRILDDPDLYAEYRNRGLERARRYDWNRIAADDLSSLRDGGGRAEGF